MVIICQDMSLSTLLPSNTRSPWSLLLGSSGKQVIFVFVCLIRVHFMFIWYIEGNPVPSAPPMMAFGQSQVTPVSPALPGYDGVSAPPKTMT